MHCFSICDPSNFNLRAVDNSLSSNLAKSTTVEKLKAFASSQRVFRQSWVLFARGVV